MKRLGPANQARDNNKTSAWNADKNSKPDIDIPALRMVPTVVAHSAAATYALENAFTMARFRADHPDRAAATKEMFRMHRRYRFSGCQPSTLIDQASRSTLRPSALRSIVYE